MPATKYTLDTFKKDCEAGTLAEHISFYNEDLSGSAFQKILSTLKKYNTVYNKFPHSINFASTNLKDDPDIKLLAEAITSGFDLPQGRKPLALSLNLANNKIAGNGAKHLSKAIRSNSAYDKVDLLSIDLSLNKELPYRGGYQLFSGIIKSGTHIKTIRFDFNYCSLIPETVNKVIESSTGNASILPDLSSPTSSDESPPPSSTESLPIQAVRPTSTTATPILYVTDTKGSTKLPVVDATTKPLSTIKQKEQSPDRLTLPETNPQPKPKPELQKKKKK